MFPCATPCTILSANFSRSLFSSVIYSVLHSSCYTASSTFCAISAAILPLVSFSEKNQENFLISFPNINSNNCLHNSGSVYSILQSIKSSRNLNVPKQVDFKQVFNIWYIYIISQFRFVAIRSFVIDMFQKKLFSKNDQND